MEVISDPIVSVLLLICTNVTLQFIKKNSFIVQVCAQGLQGYVSQANKALQIICMLYYSVRSEFHFFNVLFHFAGIVFYQEFEGLALLNIFMFLFG